MINYIIECPVCGIKQVSAHYKAMRKFQKEHYKSCGIHPTFIRDEF